ncbi:hypothetical protein TanjilG_05316 [Lupinus angustifolius]|uniref:Uncharacterized protein n=1 Tax=Lupinus angustifolius TaxID=3871 RepID=A0A4P1QW82_LUPAN|nr:hypothetical protein TanjilG_05316 [Lupinus angustifolius]
MKTLTVSSDGGGVNTAVRSQDEGRGSGRHSGSRILQQGAVRADPTSSTSIVTLEKLPIIHQPPTKSLKRRLRGLRREGSKFGEPTSMKTLTVSSNGGGVNTAVRSEDEGRGSGRHSGSRILQQGAVTADPTSSTSIVTLEKLPIIHQPPTTSLKRR